MQIIIYEAFLTAIARAVETQRPEMLAAHTKRFDSSVPFPYSENNPLPSMGLPNSAAELDYNVIASRTNASILPQQIKFSASFNVVSKRTLTSKARKFVPNDAAFQLEASLGIGFDNKDAAKKYPIKILDAEIRGLQPPGLAVMMAWFAIEGLSEGARRSGFPSEIPIFNGKLQLNLQKPILELNTIRITGEIK